MADHPILVALDQKNAMPEHIECALVEGLVLSLPGRFSVRC
jgi:hypothetical protein